jgi:hypothetical protein
MMQRGSNARPNAPMACVGGARRSCTRSAGPTSTSTRPWRCGAEEAGVPLGKADFDGKHDYPEAFSFG